MRNAHSVVLRLVGLTAAVAGLACCATTPPASSHASRTARAAPVQSRTCLTSTGSRIPPSAGDCLGVPGRSYSQRDIESTGATSAAEALSLLDPSITAH
jgi:hypothetical protein